MHSSPTTHIPLCRRLTGGISALAVMVAIALGACTNDGGDGGEPAALERRSTPSTSVHDPTQPSPEVTRGSDGGEPGGRVKLDDPASRRTTSGRVPPYVEVDAASVQAVGGELLFTMRLTGTVPQKTPPGATLRVTFRLLTEDERRISIDAQASESGWIASATGGEADGFPGSLHIVDKDVQIEIDRSYVGLLPFRWLSNVAWTKGSSYGFDSLPEQGFARYPD
jgi:hypothetical protein